MMHSNRIFATLTITVLLALAGLAAAAVAGCGGTDASASTASIQFMSPADFKVADYAGKPLVMNYFASWCGPCNIEAPELSSFAKAHPGVAIIGVAVNDKQGAVMDFMGKYGLTYPVVMDDGRLQANDGVTGVPETIFYNAAGKQVDHIIGAATTGQFDLGYAKAK